MNDGTWAANQRVLVTGGSSGMGLAIAHQFARLGADVTICGRSKERLAQAEAAISPLAQDRLRTIVADVSSETQVDRMFDQLAGIKSPTILVNCAGIGRVAPTVSLSLKNWSAVLAANLTGAFLCARRAAAMMKDQGSGVIINIGSIAAHGGLVGRAAYCTSKHGLTGLTKALAVEFAKDGIRVVQVDPGYVLTPFIEPLIEQGTLDPASLHVRTPMGRLGTSDEIAGVVLAVAGPAFGYVTGASIVVDGGWTAYAGSDPASKEKPYD